MNQSVNQTKIFKFFVVLGKLGVYVMPLYIIGFGILAWIKHTYISPADPGATASVKFTINQGASLEQIATDLETAKIINSASGFKRCAEKKQGATLLAGEYDLMPSKTPTEICDSLYGGATINYQLKISSCEKLEEVVRNIAELKLATEKELLMAFKNPRLMTELGIPAYIPEGYLSEGNYTFTKPITVDEIVKTIINKSKTEIDTKIAGWQDRASQLGYRPYEIIVLASILEKESKADPSQINQISAVYHNRLKIGMQLQSDETLIYGIPTIAGTPNDTDKAEETPYNTFANIGLPPTPICSPSIEALKAALYPSESEALYFLKKKDGSFDYSASFKEHQTKLDAQK